MSDDMKKIYDNLAERWVNHILREVELEPIRPDYLVDDGRKRERIMRVLTEEGFIQREKPGTPLLPTRKAYDAISAEKPDLTKKVFDKPYPPKDQNDLQRVPGVTWHELSLAERKWVAEHRDEYEYFHFDVNWAHQGKKPADRKDASAWFSFHKSMWLADAAYNTELERRQFEVRFNDARKQNLAWGLADQKLIEEIDADIFKSRGDDAGPFWGGGAYRFGNDPAKWEEELKKQVSTARDEIAKLTRRANVLLATQGKILEAGGWEAFLKKYDERLLEELKKEKP